MNWMAILELVSWVVGRSSRHGASAWHRTSSRYILIDCAAMSRLNATST